MAIERFVPTRTERPHKDGGYWADLWMKPEPLGAYMRYPDFVQHIEKLAEELEGRAEDDASFGDERWDAGASAACSYAAQLLRASLGDDEST